MFGADTPLVMDALQMAAVISVTVGVATWFTLRRRNRTKGLVTEPRNTGNLEKRVRVLERIATDRTDTLADEIEALRTDGKDID